MAFALLFILGASGNVAFAEPPSAAEKEAFESAKELGTVEAWDAFLSNYPSGFHADLARAYVKKLGGSGSAPAASSAANLPSARELSCKEATRTRSETSAVPAKIRFINESGVEIVLQWIDFKGQLKEYGTLKPGAEITQDTYVTHPWIAAYMEGSCRQLFLPIEGLAVARLVPQDQLAKSDGTAKKSAGDNGKSSSKTSKPSKATVEKRAKASCEELGMIYLKGKCAPKTKAERNKAEQKKSKACPAGMYRNPYGQCQPNETGG